MKIKNLIMVALLGQIQAATLTNGSFEDQSFGSSTIFSTNAATVNPLISPWTFSGEIALVPNADNSGGDTSFGEQYIAFKGGGAVEQVLTYAPGNYELSFSIAPYVVNQSSAGTVVLGFGGTDLGLGSYDTAFGNGVTGFVSGNNDLLDIKTITVPFTVTAATQNIGFKASLATIDNITITPIPEPTSALLVGLGSLSLLLRRKRA